MRCCIPAADIRDLKSLQRGAHDFMSYCSGCHSLTYLRYKRIADDLKIPEADVKAHLMFTSDNIYDGIVSAMPPADAAAWFGKQPPDLSLVARERGVDYIYSFLKGFYVDKTRIWGVNNLYLPNATMPDVLADSAGIAEAGVQERDRRKRQLAHGAGGRRIDDAGCFVAAGV